MKNKYFIFCVAGCVLFGLSACSPKSSSPTDNGAQSPPTQSESTRPPALDSSKEAQVKEGDALPAKVKKSPLPAWVNLPDLPEFPKHREDAIKGGVAYLATDDQTYLTDTGYKYFSRIAYKVTERQGLEAAAQITLDFDPGLGSLEFHYVNIIRDGRTVERLDGIDIQELRRENSLSDGLVDGDITAMIHIEDIRVGDIIDYGYSGKIQTPLWPGHYFNSFATSFTVPLARKTFEISVPRHIRLTTDSLNITRRPTIADVGERTIYRYNIVDAEPYKSFNNVPKDVFIKPYILISSMPSWQDVSDWGVDVYDIDMTLTADFKKKLKRIKKSNKSSKRRMLEIFRQVQSDIRYLGIESGVNSHQPHTPLETLAKGYGDCKDKSTLLVAALRELGISAHSVLVNTGSGHALPQLLPSITNFNHVIVLAEVNGKKYWLDPTKSYQGGAADELAPLDYGYVLPIKKGTTELVKMETPFPQTPTSDVTETYTLRETNDMLLDVKSKYTNTNADIMRRKIARNGKKGIEKSYLDYYADLYPGLTANGQINFEDNFEDNVLVISEHYQLSPEGYEKNEIVDGLTVKASTIMDKLPSSLEAERNVKLALPSNTYLNHTIKIKTPGRNFRAPEDLKLEQSGITFVRNYRSKNETLYIEYMLKVEEDFVGLTDARAVVDLADKIADEAARTVYPKAAKVSLAKRLELDFAIPKDVETKLENVGVLLQKKENIKALEALNKLEKSYVKKDAVRGYIQSLRGLTFNDLKRYDAAMPVLKEGFSLFTPDTQSIFFTYASLLRSEELDLESMDVMRRLFERHPKAVKSVNYKWLWRLTRDIYEAENFKAYDNFILSLAAAQLSHVDDIKKADLAFDMVIPILGRRGDAKQARAYLPYLTAPYDIRDILIDKELSALWPDLEKSAGKNIGIAIKNYVDETAKLAKDAPDDFKVKRQYLVALMMAGQMKDAINLGKASAENWAKIEAIGDDAYWFVDTYVIALGYEGRADEGIALLEKLLDIGIKNQSSLVNIAIDYTGFLVLNGRFEKAMSVIKTYEDMEDFPANDYGWMFIHQQRACAMTELGDKEAAFRLYTTLTKDIADDNIATHFLALICMDELDKAEQVLISRLKTKKHRDGVLPIFSTANPPKVTSSYEAQLLKKVKTFIARPKIQKAFNQYGRAIEIDGPAELWQEY